MNTTSLCIDFGNTRCKAALFSNEKITDIYRFQEDDALMTIKQILDQSKPTHSILSSVINHEDEIDTILAQNTRYTRLTSSTRLPFLNAYSSPDTLGMDRVALMAAASKAYPMQASLVIAVGTCITYNFLANNNAFRGGAISPGIDMRLRAMHDYADKLPLVSKDGFTTLVGYDTETSMRSGVLNGIAAEIDGTIARYTQQYGKINAVLTGGDGAFFESRIKSEIFADTNFLFKGLYAILHT